MLRKGVKASTRSPLYCISLTLRLLRSYIYMEHLFFMFLDHTQRRTTICRTPLDEWSALRRDLYLTTHDTHNRQISMPPVGFEPKISAGERPEAARLLRLAYVWSLNGYWEKNVIQRRYRPLTLHFPAKWRKNTPAFRRKTSTWITELV